MENLPVKQNLKFIITLNRYPGGKFGILIREVGVSINVPLELIAPNDCAIIMQELYRNVITRLAKSRFWKMVSNTSTSTSVTVMFEWVADFSAIFTPEKIKND